MATSTRATRRELQRAATKLFKSGVQPTAMATGEIHLNQAQKRQLQRSLGYRGSKARRHTIERDSKKFANVLGVELALDAAKERIEHPVRSRLRRGRHG